MPVKQQVLANRAFQRGPSLLASRAFWKAGQPALRGRAAGTRVWRKTVLRKAGAATALDVVTLAYTQTEFDPQLCGSI